MKRSEYIRKLAERLWIHNNTFKEIAFADAEKFADYAEANGYIQFDPEAKQEPESRNIINGMLESADRVAIDPKCKTLADEINTKEPGIEYPWKQASFSILPDDGSRIELKIRGVIMNGKFVSEGNPHFEPDHDLKYNLMWKTLCLHDSEWRYTE